MVLSPAQCSVAPEKEMICLMRAPMLMRMARRAVMAVPRLPMLMGQRRFYAHAKDAA